MRLLVPVSLCLSLTTLTLSAKEREFSYSIKFRLHDKLAALEKLGRHLGMFKETGEGSSGNQVNVGPSKNVRSRTDQKVNPI